MSAVSAMGGAVTPNIGHANTHSPTQKLQEIQNEAIASHQAEVKDTHDGEVNITI